MKGAFRFIIVAIAASLFVDAGHHHSGVSVSQGFVSTSPEVVDKSERTVTCPHGTKQHGKECIHTVTVQPTVRCPFGFFRSMEHENVCSKFFNQEFECPDGFVREKGICVRTRKVEPLVQCPSGFTVMPDGRQCSRNVPLPNKAFCPPGSVQRGEVCIKKVPVAPEFVCPPGFTLEDHRRCKTVETFDCTPVTPPMSKDVVASDKHHHGHHHKHLRLLGETHHATSTVVVSKETPPVEKEFVVQKTCKRVRLEDARKICPKGSSRHSKECFVEEEVPFHEKKGGFKEQIVKANFVCPEGHFPSSPVGRFHCLVKEDVVVRGVCPPHTEPVDHKCAKFAPLIASCPPDHKLIDGLCVKRIVVHPIVEFNVAFKCVGKDCDHHHAGSSMHHHK